MEGYKFLGEGRHGSNYRRGSYP